MTIRNMYTNMTHKILIYSSLLSLLCLATGCAGPRILVPAPSSLMQRNEGVQTLKGITVEVTGEGWNADPEVYDEVTPIKITIKNDSDSPLRISYSIFSLFDSEGNLSSVLPPYSIEEKMNEDAASSEFTCSGFYVAPYYSRYYPNMLRYEDPFFYDPIYNQHYYSCWKNNSIELPTKEMINKALPEGVLWQKVTVSGYLYFEKVKESEKYRFRMDVIDIKTGVRLGEISIPMIVREDGN